MLDDGDSPRVDSASQMFCREGRGVLVILDAVFITLCMCLWSMMVPYHTAMQLVRMDSIMQAVEVV